MENKYYITVPMKDWESLNGEIDTLHDRLMELNGKPNVSVVKFGKTELNPSVEFTVYTNEEIITQLGKREEGLKHQIDILYRELEKFNNKKWWEFWL